MTQKDKTRVRCDILRLRQTCVLLGTPIQYDGWINMILGLMLKYGEVNTIKSKDVRTIWKRWANDWLTGADRTEGTALDVWHALSAETALSHITDAVYWIAETDALSCIQEGALCLQNALFVWLDIKLEVNEETGSIR